ncbi:MAG: citramalate synthase, partial [Devosiaceae bacterium]|nr:citramalate synthase [Devosiaceae bacterium]
SIEQSIKATINAGKEAMLDCEHFFDGYKANPTYAKSCIKRALDAGANWVVLCDTNGGTLPFEIEQAVSEILEICPGEKLGIHAHNDTGNAIANSLAAVRAGVRQVQGTLGGIGERCGNANLITLIPTLMLKNEFCDKSSLSINNEQLKKLTHISRAFDDILNRAPNDHSPYVGSSAFATKAGIHASALVKYPQSYEHIEPELVGNQRSIKMSQQAGKSNLLVALKRHDIEVDKNDERLSALLKEVKEREARGYSYDGADASFALLAHKNLGTLPKYFEVEGYRTSIERRHNVKGELVTVSEAVVKINIEGELFMSVAEGNGPVNALDQAMRKDLGKYSDIIKGLELVDFKVRILDGGTGAVTRVLIESKDESGERWVTIGVSPNIIDASFEALYESITYKLMKSSNYSI